MKEEKKATRQSYGEALLNLGRKNENISDGVVVEESLGRYSIEVMSKDDAVSKLKDLEQKGNYALYVKMSKPLIIDGRAQNWNNIRRWSDGLISDKKIFELGIPILGICYGMQFMSQTLGGEVKRANKREYGTTDVNIDNSSLLFEGFENTNGFLILLSTCDSAAK